MTVPTLRFYRFPLILSRGLSILLLTLLVSTAGSSQEATLTKGQLPILLVAPHGGSDRLSKAPIRRKNISQDTHFNVKKDMKTAELTRQLVEQFPSGQRPSVLLCQIHRRYVDMNRSPKRAAEHPQAQEAHRKFHSLLSNELERLEKQHGWALLLDIHGNFSEPFHLVVGTREGKTLSPWGHEAIWGRNGLMKGLSRLHISHSPPRADSKIRYNGGYIVRHYGKSPKIDAWQLEHNKELRFTPSRRQIYVRFLADFLLKQCQRRRL